MKQIKIFTTPTCAYCSVVKKYLTNKGHQYEVIDLSQDPEQAKEALRISGALTVPITAIYEDDEVKDVIIGANFGKLATI